MLRTISWVVAPCSSTAAAMLLVTRLIASISPVIIRIAWEVPCVAAWIAPTCWAISSVARRSGWQVP